MIIVIIIIIIIVVVTQSIINIIIIVVVTQSWRKRVLREEGWGSVIFFLEKEMHSELGLERSYRWCLLNC